MAKPGEVDGAGGVQGLLRRSGGESGEQGGFLVTIVGGGVDREAEGVGRAAVAQPAQRDLFAVVQDAGDVGGGAAVGGLDAAELGPVLFGVGEQPQRDRALGGGGDGGHGLPSVPHRLGGPLRSPSTG